METSLELSQTRQKTMDPVSEPSQAHQNMPPQGRILQVDFSWKRFKGLITDKDLPEAKAVYIVDMHTMKSPHLIFKHASDNTTFGTGTLHPISINASCTVSGRKTQIKALKRFKTSYTHLSRAFSDTEDLMPMTWSSDSDFKTWDFVCLDKQLMPVAKFSANIWAVQKVGNIEFLGDKADNKEAREEIVVTGLTLFYCMCLRMNNILNLFGAIFSKPGPIKQSS
jgi:hypothetical protein